MIIHNLEITTIKRPRGSIVGFASFTINDDIRCDFVAIHKDLGGYRITYPKKISNGFNRHVFYPVTTEAEKQLEAVIIERFKEIVGDYRC